MLTATDEYLTVTQVAAVLAVSERTVYNWTDKHILPQPIRIGPRGKR